MSLLAWYPFNGDFENYGLSDEFDLTKEGNISTNVDGKIGRFSIGFENENYHLKSSANALERLISMTKYTIMCWVKPTGKYGLHSCSLLSSGNWNNVNIVFALNTLENNKFTKILVPNIDGYWNGVTVPDGIELNKWYHIAVSFDGTNSTVYVNGKNIGSVACGGINRPDVNYFYIGAATYTSGFSFKGFMNDFRIYDECLSPKEIYEISKGLVVHYDFNCKDVINSALPNTTITFERGGLSTMFPNSIIDSKIGTECSYLRGTTTVYERCISNEDPQWTVAAWLYPTSSLVTFTGSSEITARINNFNCSNGKYFGTFMAYNGGIKEKPFLRVSNEIYAYGSKSLLIDQWNHLVFTFNGNIRSRDAMHIYLNGEDITGNSVFNNNSEINPSDDLIKLVGDFPGYCADYKEYATALSAEDVLKEYQSRASLNNKYKMMVNELVELKPNLAELANASPSLKGYKYRPLLKKGDSLGNAQVFVDINNNIPYENNKHHFYRIKNNSNANNQRLVWQPAEGDLQNNHRYIIKFDIEGTMPYNFHYLEWQSCIGASNMKATIPALTKTEFSENHRTGKHTWYYDFTIGDLCKVCTSSIGDYVAGEEYFMYNGFVIGFHGANTAEDLDVYLDNFGVYDVTDLDLPNILEIQSNSTLNTLSLTEGENKYCTSDYTFIGLNEIIER